MKCHKVYHIIVAFSWIIDNRQKSTCVIKNIHDLNPENQIKCIFICIFYEMIGNLPAATTENTTKIIFNILMITSD